MSRQVFLDVDDVSIIEGTPFLYIKSLQSIVLGDLHLGHQDALVSSGSRSQSIDIERVLRLLDEVFQCKINITTVILNGDIKHKTRGILKQEVEDIRLLVEWVVRNELNLISIKGNHDRLLEPILNSMTKGRESFLFKEIYKDNGYLFVHGDRDILEQELKGIHTIILSHEHPSYVMRGIVGESVKLNAFVTLQGLERKVVILPATGYFTVGTKFPLKNRDRFLSPFLQKHANLSSQKIYPYDEDMGVLKFFSEDRFLR